MQDKTYQTAKVLKDSINKIEAVVDNMLKAGAPEQFEYFEIVMRFGINLLAMIILVRLIYYTTHKNKDYLFTFFLFNILIFIICLLLGSTKIKMGFAFGLFAIFSIIRYRTVTVPIKEMGYFFTCVALGLVNALAETDGNFYVIMACNAVVLLLTLFLDKFIGLKHENAKEIVYERIDLIQPERRKEMIADLQKRTGLPIHRVEIRNVNFLRDTANIFAYYFAKNNENRKDLESK
jgi:hypothetical protein